MHSRARAQCGDARGHILPSSRVEFRVKCVYVRAFVSPSSFRARALLASSPFRYKVIKE